MINLISWLYFYFFKAIRIVIGQIINKIVGLAINRAISIEKKVTINFFELFL